ncbi:MAG: carboxymuconolactone decarboxylase family protein [Pseudomonadota bacterium]
MSPSSVFPFLRKSDLPDELHSLWDQSVARRGEARFVSGAAHSPGTLKWYIESFYGQLFYGGEVPARYKQLGRLRLSTVHGCASCNRGNRIDAADNGLNEAQIHNIHDAAHACFDDADRAVLALADLVSMDGNGRRLDAATYDALKEHFSNGQIIELAMTLAFLSGMARFLFAFDLVEKEDYCAF